MTFNTELRKLMLAVGADAIIKRTTLTKPHSRGADDEREQETSVAYPFRHAREYRNLSRTDPKQWPHRPFPAKVVDGNVAMRRGSERAKAQARARTGLSAPQITAQTLYDETLRDVRVSLGENGCSVLVMAWDKAQPKIKREEGEKRKAVREEAGAKRKAEEEAARAAKRLKAGANGVAVDAAAQPPVQDVERDGYIPACAYTPDGSDMTFREGYLIRYATAEDDTGGACTSESGPRIVNATSEFDFDAVMDIPKLRKELVQWICKIIACGESKRWPNVRFCIDHQRGKPPTCWRNGKRLVGELGEFTTGHYFEGDHAVGAWAAALLREKRDVVVWTVDGDLLLVCLWAVFNMRYSTQHIKDALHAIRRDPGDAKAHAAYWRDLAADVAHAGYRSQPVAARFGDEPRLILILQGNMAGSTVMLDVNVMLTRMCNAFMSPSHWSILAMLLENDYVEHSEIADRIGVKTLLKDFAMHISPVSAPTPKDAQKRVHDALWVFSRTWARSPDTDGRKQRHSAITQGRMFDAAVRAMSITVVPRVTPRVATRCTEALWRWRRCSLLSATEGLPAGCFAGDGDEVSVVPASDADAEAAVAGDEPVDFREAADEHALGEMADDACCDMRCLHET